MEVSRWDSHRKSWKDALARLVMQWAGEYFCHPDESYRIAAGIALREVTRFFSEESGLPFHLCAEADGPMILPKVYDTATKTYVTDTSRHIPAATLLERLADSVKELGTDEHVSSILKLFYMNIRDIISEYLCEDHRWEMRHDEDLGQTIWFCPTCGMERDG